MVDHVRRVRKLVDGQLQRPGAAGMRRAIGGAHRLLRLGFRFTLLDRFLGAQPRDDVRHAQTLPFQLLNELDARQGGIRKVAEQFRAIRFPGHLLDKRLG